MSFKVVRNIHGVAVAFGPNDANYEPSQAYEVETDAPVMEPEIPAVSPRQIRQALSLAGLRSAVESAVAAGDQDLKDWYEFSTAFERLNPQVVAMGEALSVSPASLDDLWALGAQL